MRIGHGFDAHRLEAGRPLWLGGIEVPHDRGLAGHSDGDVVAHALVGAVLGGAGLGDMGQHFPSTEDRWRGVGGAELLGEAAALARQAGLVVVSAQAVAIAEAPRLAPHLRAMGAVLDRALGVSAGTVAVTVSSTDGLGFVGRGEGLAASAVVLLAPVS